MLNKKNITNIFPKLYGSSIEFIKNNSEYWEEKIKGTIIGFTSDFQEVLLSNLNLSNDLLDLLGSEPLSQYLEKNSDKIVFIDENVNEDILVTQVNILIMTITGGNCHKEFISLQKEFIQRKLKILQNFKEKLNNDILRNEDSINYYNQKLQEIIA